ncbi:hypothetical protein UFOVP411_26 [uncultured Caudovirales phage]|uniref:Uncharacterized protein n=1 Tax=uncultured Caudovirales phage TaxID=2100421 RepID=A0A6J5M7E8_9CAUD|nr:hypothetical protein UFOVP411_26 [uncultured Caudovirales phage]
MSGEVSFYGNWVPTASRPRRAGTFLVRSGPGAPVVKARFDPRGGWELPLGADSDWQWYRLGIITPLVGDGGLVATRAAWLDR